MLEHILTTHLYAGNTVVCKPSEMTSVTAWMLAQICNQVKLGYI